MKFNRNSITLYISIFVGILVTWQNTRAQPASSLEELVVSSTVERIATDFKFTEGPVWHPDGYLLFSDVPANTIYKWTTDGKTEVFRSPSNYSSGLTFDKQGRKGLAGKIGFIHPKSVNGTLIEFAQKV